MQNGYANFNPRSPCGERLDNIFGCISPILFQSTLPLRGATALEKSNRDFDKISIHAPLAGSDRRHAKGTAGPGLSIHAPLAGSDTSFVMVLHPGHDFNPRSPCGERRHGPSYTIPELVFQSTLPLRGATLCRSCSDIHITISIHAPLAGSDSHGVG